MKRIYHPYNLWEDFKHGFYDNCSGEIKAEKLLKVSEFFSDQNLVYQFMDKVLKEWRYSVEHNLTNNSINKIAYLGQSACCLCFGVPNTVTMEAWSKLSKKDRDQADAIAITLLKKYGYGENL